MQFAVDLISNQICLQYIRWKTIGIPYNFESPWLRCHSEGHGMTSWSTTGVVQSVDDLSHLTSASVTLSACIVTYVYTFFNIAPVVDTWNISLQRFLQIFQILGTIGSSLMGPSTNYDAHSKVKHCVQWSFVSLMWKGISTSIANWVILVNLFQILHLRSENVSCSIHA